MSGLTSDDVRTVARGGTMFGIITMILGLMAMGAPLASGLAVVTIVGVFLLLAGVTQLVFAFKAPSMRERVVVFLFGGIATLAGVTIVARPLLGLATITMVLMVYFLLDGVTTVATGWRMRPEPGSGWMIFGGATSILLGILLMAKWPLSGAWAVGVLVGIRLVMRGSSMIAMSAVGRQVARNLDGNDG